MCVCVCVCGNTTQAMTVWRAMALSDGELNACVYTTMEKLRNAGLSCTHIMYSVYSYIQYIHFAFNNFEAIAMGIKRYPSCLHQFKHFHKINSQSRFVQLQHFFIVSGVWFMETEERKRKRARAREREQEFGWESESHTPEVCCRRSMLLSIAGSYTQQLNASHASVERYTQTPQQ